MLCFILFEWKSCRYLKWNILCTILFSLEFHLTLLLKNLTLFPRISSRYLKRNILTIIIHLLEYHLIFFSEKVDTAIWIQVVRKWSVWYRLLNPTFQHFLWRVFPINKFKLKQNHSKGNEDSLVGQIAKPKNLKSFKIFCLTLL